MRTELGVIDVLDPKTMTDQMIKSQIKNYRALLFGDLVFAYFSAAILGVNIATKGHWLITGLAIVLCLSKALQASNAAVAWAKLEKEQLRLDELDYKT